MPIIASKSLLRATCKHPTSAPATPSKLKKRKRSSKSNANSNILELKVSSLVSFPYLVQLCCVTVYYYLFNYLLIFLLLFRLVSLLSCLRNRRLLRHPIVPLKSPY